MNIEKIQSIRLVSAKCMKFDASDLNLIFKALGIDAIDSRFWHSEEYGNWVTSDLDRKEYIYGILESMTPEKLRKLDIGLDTMLVNPEKTSDIVSGDLVPLFLFGSHLAKHKKVVSEVGNSLSLLGISLFIAHESIRPTADFQQEIRNSLNEVHGGLIFFHDGFGSSLWCDQEVGWLIGRQLPYFTLKYGKKPPHGFIARDQALSVTERTTQAKVVQEIVDWVSNNPDLRPRFIDSLLLMLSRSTLFSSTDGIWKHLRLQQGLSKTQIDYLLAVTRENYQIHGAECRVGTFEDGKGASYPRVIWKFAKSQTYFDADSEEVTRFSKRFSSN